MNPYLFIYLFAKKHKLTKAQDLKNAKFKLGQSKARVDEIECVLTKLYEDNALGKITDERFERLLQHTKRNNGSLPKVFLKQRLILLMLNKIMSIWKSFLKLSELARI